jgi:polysaccharide pyruvyl transferase WcaK-like protein
MVALLGVTRNTDNYGVRVLMSAAIEALAKADPHAEIVLLDYGQQPETWTEQTQAGPRRIRLVNSRFSWRLHLPNNVVRLLALALWSRLLPGAERRRKFIEANPWLGEIQRSKTCFSLAGGDSFSDIYGLPRFFYVVFPQLLVLLLNRPLVLFPQTYGPFGGRLARSMARYILRNARTVFSRDEAGVDVVRAVTGSDRPVVHVVPDIGFAMASEPLDASLARTVAEIRTTGPVVGLNVSSLLYMGGYTGDNMFQLREAFPALIDALVEHLVIALGARLLLIPHVCGGPLSEEDESRLCRQLEEKYRRSHGDSVRYVADGLNHRQMKALIGECDLFIGARMHACIGAVSQGVPSVCLAYSKKFAGVMQPLGAGARVVDLRVATIADVLRATTEVFDNRLRLRTELQCAATELLRRLDGQLISGLLLRNPFHDQG